ncbi:hypothetical protein GCM10022254_67280 [Actinomadura meridiana]|uniref:histidine kinase n=1 Tax=Actinomadura meridiana TaxID=559626 RepID=A0ABP8CM98_9ACTN
MDARSAASRSAVEAQRQTMVNDIAHELRTPLSNIRVWLEAAEDGVAIPDGAFVSSLLEEALQLQHLVDDLQDLAAAEAGTLRLHFEPMDVRELLTRVADAHRAKATSAGSRLTVYLDGDPPLTADAVRIRQAVANLLTNAIRHTPNGHITLTARDDDGWTVIEVADTGTGIPPEDLPQIFDRFWRADKSRNRQTGGSGLGLAIVRQLVQAHGGTAEAHSQLGEGSTFTLRLPRQPQPAPS